MNNSSSRLGPIALCLISLGAIAIHSASHLPFLSDDALISLRYARRLLQGQGLTWTDGPAVEGYSNLLWTLLAAALGWLGLDLIDAVRILGWIGMGSVPVVVAVWTGWVDAPRERGVGLAMGMLAWGVAAPVAVWAIGGLEQPLVAALLVLTIPLCYRVAEADPPRASRVLATSTLLGLLCLARLDGALFSVAALAAVGLVRRGQGRRAPRSVDLLLLAVPLLCVLGQAVFRWTYYGELIPNTALVKVAPSAYHAAVGVHYVARGLIALFPWPVVGVLCLLALLASAQRRPRGVVLSTFLLLWLAYLMVVGGDIFPAHRHLVPVCVLLLFAVVDGSGPLLRGVRRRFGSSRRAAAALLLLVWLPFPILQIVDPEVRRARAERWEWDLQVLGLLLGEAFSDRQPLLAVTAAGGLPYWSELPCLDMLGLNDYYLPRHRPPDMGGGYPGHELGEGSYVLGRRPDIVCFHVGMREPLFRSGIEMFRTPEFAEAYSPVTVLGTRPHRYEATLWFLRDSERIGIRRTRDTIHVPGYLLAAGEGAVARLDDAGQLVLELPPGREVGVDLRDIAPGRWAVEVVSSTPAKVRRKLRRSGRVLSVRLSTHDAGPPVEVSELVLRRLPSFREPAHAPR